MIDLGEVIAKLLDSNPHPTNPRLVDTVRVFWKKPFLVRRVLAQGVTPGIGNQGVVFGYLDMDIPLEVSKRLGSLGYNLSIFHL